MHLSVRPLAAPPGIVKLWVGIFGVNPVPAELLIPTFRVNNTQLLPIGTPVMRGIRDRYPSNGGPLNWFGVYQFDVSGLENGQPQKKLTIETTLLGLAATPATIDVAPVPANLDNGFTILLSSCYYQEGDTGLSRAELKNRLIHNPDLVLLAGDQVYLDNPFFENIPSHEPALSQKLGDKYRKNFCPTGGQASLYPLLKLAPTACIPDDHELWNNFPNPSPTMSGSVTSAGYERLRIAARRLYEDYQLGEPGMQGAQKLDVGPLHLLLLDTRFDRSEDTNALHGLFSKQTEDELLAWKQKLVGLHLKKELAVGVLACGQVLFDQAPGLVGGLFDENLQKYRQFSLLQDITVELATEGVPVLYLSGDVHFSRVSSAALTKTGNTCLYEVICSPTSLVTLVPGKSLPSSPHAPPSTLVNNRFITKLESPLIKGDAVSTLHFIKDGTGLKVTVTYYLLTDPFKPNTTVTFPLTPRFKG